MFQVISFIPNHFRYTKTILCKIPINFLQIFLLQWIRKAFQCGRTRQPFPHHLKPYLFQNFPNGILIHLLWELPLNFSVILLLLLRNQQVVLLTAHLEMKTHFQICSHLMEIILVLPKILRTSGAMEKNGRISRQRLFLLRIITKSKNLFFFFTK